MQEGVVIEGCIPMARGFDSGNEDVYPLLFGRYVISSFSMIGR